MEDNWFYLFLFVLLIGLYLMLEFKFGPKYKRMEIDADRQVIRVVIRQYKQPSIEDEKQYPFSLITRVKQFKDKRGKELGVEMVLIIEEEEASEFIDSVFCRALAKRVPDTTTYLKSVFGAIPVEMIFFTAKKKHEGREHRDP